MTGRYPLFSKGAELRYGRAGRGFTLLELLVVIAIVAIATSGVAMALRDSGQAQLEREAQRLAALLDGARAQSRATGVPVRWRATANGFVFEGLPVERKTDVPTTWLAPGVASSAPQPLVLGPEPLIAAQSVRLWLLEAPQRSLTVSTDGVRPFTVQSENP